VLDRFFDQPRAKRRLRHGPLGPHMDVIAERLVERGYNRNTARDKLLWVGDLSWWMKEQPAGATDPLFPSARGGPLSRDGLGYLLAKHWKIATARCPSLAAKRASPHVLRHTAAMDLLHHGVDRATIALWLGHESVETTQTYLHADLALKEKALAKTRPLNIRAGRFHPGDRLLAFLKGLG